jgi:hypothetical protein
MQKKAHKGFFLHPSFKRTGLLRNLLRRFSQDLGPECGENGVYEVHRAGRNRGEGTKNREEGDRENIRRASSL